MRVLFSFMLLTTLPGIVSAASVPERAIRHFGGRLTKPEEYAESVSGFQKYLRDSGVRKVSATQMTRPHHVAIARDVGFDVFLPKKAWWSRGAALALLAQAIEEAIGEPVTIRNWWRPARYNADARVAGAKRSDHLTAHAIDIDYRSRRSAERARRWLEELRRKQPWLRLSVGSGPITTHVGIDSPLGSRQWTYDKH